MELYSFYNNYTHELTDDNWIGYVTNYYFNINDDGSLTMEEKTPSPGMWSVYKTYMRDDNGIFKEIKKISTKFYMILWSVVTA